MVVKGNTSSSAQSVIFETPVSVKSYSLVNKSAGSLTVTAGAILGSTLVLFCSKILTANDSYQYIGNDVLIEKGYSVFVTASGASLDYYFFIE